LRNEGGTNVSHAIPEGHTVPKGYAIDYTALRSGKIAAMGERYLIFKVPKTRIEVPIIPRYSVIVVFAKTTRNNPVQSSWMNDQAGRTPQNRMRGRQPV